MEGRRGNRKVLITGGTGALGTAVTRRFLADGHSVAVTWVVEAEAQALRDALGEDAARVMFVECDVTDPDDVRSGVESVTRDLGGVEVLVHLVGGWKGGERLHEHSLATWDKMLTLNLRTAFLCCREVLPTMLADDWGRIILVASRAARSERAGQAGYAVAKAGVAVLGEAIAEETRGTGVTANVVAPSMLDTEANRRASPDADHTAWVPPSEVAGSISFLASEEAGQLRGAWLPVYGSA
ncbi:3-oxoacyl-ACP reductase FabG [soil metagenome]